MNQTVPTNHARASPAPPSRSAGAPGPRPPCAYCRAEIPPTKRKTARTCSKRCRQAIHRIERNARILATATHPMRLAYADPPYPGRARLYRDQPEYAGEVDLASLLQELDTYDGWALSTSADALPTVLSLCVARGRTVRVAAWFRGQRNHNSLYPASTWEPVIFAGGRHVAPAAHSDALIYTARPRTTDPRQLLGSKPAAFCYWMFDLLGARPPDTVADLYPGTGIVSRCWQTILKRAAPPTSTRDAAQGTATPCLPQASSTFPSAPPVPARHE